MAKFLLLLLFPCGLLAQKVAFTALSNAKSVAVGVPFEVSFRLDNDRVKSFTPPDFKDFDQLSAPSTMSSMSYVNGVSTSFETRSYMLAAQKTGDFTIGAAKVLTAGGKTLSSNPLKVSVSKGDNNSNTAAGSQELGDKVLLRIEVNPKEAVVGEQVVVDLKIYSQIGIEEIELLREPEVGNMFSHKVRTFDEATNLEVVNGKQYKSKILNRLVVFPSQSGTTPIEAAIGQIGVLQSGNNGMFSMFQRMQTYTVKSNAASIEVKALDGSPANFLGAVGNYTLQAYVEKNTITSDDVIQVNLRITGEGDIKQILPPPLHLPINQFELYPPNIKEEVREGNGVLGGVKEIEYIITPKVVGDVAIRPTFVFFDPQKRRFVQLDTTLHVQIAQGSKPLPTAQLTAPADSNQTAVVPKTMLPPLSETTLYHPSGRWLGSFTFWLLAIVPVGAAAAWAVWHQREQARKALITKEMLQQKFAGREAQKRLAVAHQAKQSNDTSTFYPAISNALLGYVGDKLQIPKTSLHDAYLRQKWTDMQLSDDFIRTWETVMRSCEMAMFAASADARLLNDLYDKAVDIIQTLEKTT